MRYPVDDLTADERARLRPSYLARERVLRAVRRTAVGRGLHRVYRLARGRSSRPA